MMLPSHNVEAAYQLSLVLSNIFCTTVSGYVLIFGSVVMPGIGQLPDGEFLHSFQKMDGIIQKNDPIFVSSWLGSILSLALSTGLAAAVPEEARDGAIWVWLGAASYLVGQLTTFAKNIPLNNRIQTLVIDQLDSFEQKAERELFESPWRFWNKFRTVFFLFTSAVLHVALLQVES